MWSWDWLKQAASAAWNWRTSSQKTEEEIQKQVAWHLEQARKREEEIKQDREEERDEWRKERKDWNKQVEQLRAEMEERVAFFKRVAEEVKAINASQAREFGEVRHMLEAESATHRKCRADVTELQEENERLKSRVASLERRLSHASDSGM